MDRLISKMSAHDIDLIMFAYDLSKEAHRTHSRKLGGRYFEHPRAGCIILMDELGIYDRDLLIAFLLHDVGEDSPLLGNVKGSYDEFIRIATFRITLVFGERVAKLVTTLTKPSEDKIRFHTKEEWYQFYITELAKDGDAQILKAVDRLHNLRTLPPQTKWAASQILETTSIYLPMFSKIQSETMETLVAKITTAIEVLEAVPT
ncbi:MAG: relA 1 [Patescibacteria group bacterium]|nr:relA 1 [Patescibacteria group bacterium]